MTISDSWHLLVFSGETASQLELEGFMKEFWLYYQKHPDSHTVTIWKNHCGRSQKDSVLLSPQASAIASGLVRFYSGKPVDAPDLSGFTDLIGNAMCS